MQGLAELSALAGALGDTRLELDVRLRRAATLRMQEEEERAATLAREVRELAASKGDAATELAACIELGQDLLKSPLGEGYIPPAREVDFDGAEEAYRRAAELAKELGDDASLAAALREQGVIELGRVREWFVDRILTNEQLPVVRRIAAGESIDDILPELPIAPAAEEAGRDFQEALELFERLGDRRGAMSTIIAMGYLSWAADIHLGSNAARHIEEIRRLTFAMRAFTNESERVASEAQMLYGVHVFARAKVIPDLAVSRGEEAYEKAREIGDRSLEFLAAGGTALALFDLGEVDEGGPGSTAPPRPRSGPDAAPGPPARDLARPRRRGRRRRRADARHLERAVELAADQGRPAARCEALALLAIEAARLGAERSDQALLDVAERAASEAAALAPNLPGIRPGGPRPTRRSLRSRWPAATGTARSSRRGRRCDAGGRAAGGPVPRDGHAGRERHAAHGGAGAASSTASTCSGQLAMIAQRTLDEDVRVRWFRGPVGRELSSLADRSRPRWSATATGEGATGRRGDRVAAAA